MKKRILVVEDDKFLRQLITKKLTNEGFEVLEAIDGEEGIKKTKKDCPDLILLDIILPEIDGFEVLSRIKKQCNRASIPVIILSNLGQKKDIEKGLRLGAKDYLIKAHFTPEEIIVKVNKALEDA